jgi:hypothetical protein
LEVPRWLSRLGEKDAKNELAAGGLHYDREIAILVLPGDFT